MVICMAFMFFTVSKLSHLPENVAGIFPLAGIPCFLRALHAGRFFEFSFALHAAARGHGARFATDGGR